MARRRRRRTPTFEVEPEMNEIDHLKRLLEKEMGLLPVPLEVMVREREEIMRRIEHVDLGGFFESGRVWLTVIPEKEEVE